MKKNISRFLIKTLLFFFIKQANAQYNVKDYNSLLEALNKVRPHETILLKKKIKIDLTNKPTLIIPAFVTIKSKSNKKAVLFTTSLGDSTASPLILINGDSVKIIGIRIIGADTLQRNDEAILLQKENKFYSLPLKRGIECRFKGLEVVECELMGFSHAAIFLKQNASAFIHHNQIHHNQRRGLGYGICLDRAFALIQYNIFDWNRHHVAGTGLPGTSYEASYNISYGHGNSYAFDMHGQRDRKDSIDAAGTFISIHNNTFYLIKQSAILINGNTVNEALIYDNKFKIVQQKTNKNQIIPILGSTTNRNLKIKNNTITHSN